MVEVLEVIERALSLLPHCHQATSVLRRLLSVQLRVALLAELAAVRSYHGQLGGVRVGVVSELAHVRVVDRVH